MSAIAAFAQALKGLLRELLGGTTGPAVMLADAIACLETAGRQLRIHLAELAMSLGRAHRRLGEVAPGDPLHDHLTAQVGAMAERLGHLRLHLADLEGKVLQLKALQADLRLDADLRDVRGRLQQILGDLSTLASDPLAELSDELNFHQDIRATLSELRQGGLLR